MRYSLNSFRTKQVLDKSYKRYSEEFKYGVWLGEYSRKYNLQEIQSVIKAFENSRDRDFELIHRTDYRYVYKSRDLPIDIYLKEYRLWNASYSRFTIIKRNIFRRTLAKKAFALSFKFEEMGIKTVESLFYAMVDRSYIPANSIYISRAIQGAIPISYYFEKLRESKPKNNFTDNFKESVKRLDSEILKERYLKFVERLIDRGVRGFYREFEGNILIDYKEDGDFDLILCDLDIVDAILEFDEEEKTLHFQRAKESFERLIDGIER
jgi:hypothetical protein